MEKEISNTIMYNKGTDTLRIIDQLLSSLLGSRKGEAQESFTYIHQFNIEQKI